MKRLLSLSVFLMMALLSFAHDFQVKNADGKTIYYNITSSSAPYTVAVTYKGTSSSEYSNEYNGSVTIPKSVSYGGKTYSVTSIGSFVFGWCSGLTSVTIPNSVTSIGDYAFSSCSGLTSVTIPNSVTSIGEDAFWNCSGLTSVTIPNSVTSIGDYAFLNCIGLTSVTINSDSIISNTSLEYNLKNIFGSQVKSYIIGDGVTSIGWSVFDDCSGLTSVTIPNSVTSIDGSAFALCNGLTSITIPNSVTSIGWSAFSGCSGLTSLTIGNSVTTIGDFAFSGCSGLTSITIPNSVTTIGKEAFYECSSLTSITFPNSVTSIGYYAFNGTAWYDNQPNGLVYAGKVAYEYKGTMPGNTKIALKEGTLSISGVAFAGCSGLTSITIPNSVTAIGSRAFYGCSGLNSVTIPNSVTSIGWVAFSGCSGLTSVTIGSSVKTIGQEAFSDCTGLTELVSLASIPPICDAGVFENVDKSLCTLKVPKGSKDDYSQADQWKNFVNIEEVDVTGIEAVTAEGVSNSEITDI